MTANNRDMLPNDGEPPREEVLVGRELAGVRCMLSEQAAAVHPSVTPLLAHALLPAGGLIRPRLLLLCGRCFGELGQTHVSLAAAVEMIHAATLLHDDVIDGASRRRGKATAHSLWGEHAAIISGDYLLALAFELAGKVCDHKVNSILCKAAQEMCQGELRQNLLRDDWAIGEETYFEIIAEKTASFFSACCKLGAVVSGGSPAQVETAGEFGIKLGVAYQVVDDIRDIAGNTADQPKKGGSDLANSKPTLPVIHMLSAVGREERSNLVSRLRSSPASDWLLESLRRTGSLRYAVAAAREQTADAIQSLSLLEDCPARDCLADIARKISDDAEGLS